MRWLQGRAVALGECDYAQNRLGLPIEFARTLSGMLADDQDIRYRAGDYFLDNMRYMKHIVATSKLSPHWRSAPLIPFVLSGSNAPLETVVYSSRKSFLREEMGADKFDAQVSAKQMQESTGIIKTISRYG